MSGHINSLGDFFTYQMEVLGGYAMTHPPLPEWANTEPRSSRPWLQLASGAPFDAEPNPEGRYTKLSLDDMAHALSHLCRFGGHTRLHYSVAEHSVLVAMRVWQLVTLAGMPLADKIRVTRAALLHDGTEAVLVDIPRPWKYTDVFDGYREQERLLHQDLMLQYNCAVSANEQKVIDQADNEMLAVEKRDVMSPSVRVWVELPQAPSGYHAGRFDPQRAKREFLLLAKQLGLSDGEVTGG